MNTWMWAAIVILFCALLAWPKLVWEIRHPFLWTNRLQWLLQDPLRHWQRDPRSEWPRRLFLILFPVQALYQVVAHVVLSPLRLANALYFDLLLFWSVSLRDNIADLARPHYRETGFQYALRWTLYLPWRLVQFCLRSPGAILQGTAMAGFDLLWPTLTLFHGTGREEARTIARTGEWYAGTGNYVGTGLYFGLRPDIAQHYARMKRDPLVIIARVTLAPCRPVATLPEDLRRQIGRDGDAISRGLKSPWVSLEHWRTDRRWYEFCLMQPSQYDPTKPWRVRPICTVGKTGPERLIGGPARWPHSGRGWGLLVGSLLVLLAPIVYLSSPALSTSIAHLATQGRLWSCPGAPVSRVAVGDSACVADIGPSPLRIRATPEISPDNIVGDVYRGTRVALTDGPACADGYTWWRIQVDAGPAGWVAEGGPGGYYLEPCD